MAWQWLQRLWRPHQLVELAEISASNSARVEFDGRVEQLETLNEPLEGDSCVAFEYRAWPPSTTIGIEGGTSHNSRYQVNARQAVDFVLTDGAVRVLVRPDPGEEVGDLHERLVARYGVGLRAETDIVEAGQRLRVSGTVEHRSVGAGHRELPYVAIVRAEKIRLI